MRQLDVDQNGVAYHKTCDLFENWFLWRRCMHVSACVHVRVRACVCVCACTLNMQGTGNCSSQGRHIYGT